YMAGHTGETVSLLANLITSKDKYGEQAINSMLNIPDVRLKEVDLHPLKTNIQHMLQKEEKGTVSKELLLLGKKTGALLSGEEQREFLELVESSETLVIQLSTLPGKMDFDLKNFTVPTGRSVEIVFSNPDDMPHNVLILKPGSLEKVGKMADNMAQSPDGYEKNFVPDTKLVLFSSPLINSNQDFTLKFVSPKEEGEFPFACTFPGHWRTMNGVMKVVSTK